MHFRYQAVSPSGQLVTDTMEAQTPKKVALSLEADGYEFISAQIDWGATFRAGARTRKLKRKIIIEFFSYLKSLLAMGLNINTALEAVQESIPDPILSPAVGEVRDMVEKGYAFSESLERTKLFPTLAMSAIKAGEEAGRLSDVFGELAEHYRKMDALATNAKKAATYPMIALCVLSFVVLMLLGFVVPQLKDVLPKDVPMITSIMLWLSENMMAFIVPIFVAVVVGIISYKKVAPEKRAAIWSAIYRLPVIGTIGRDLELSTVFMNLAMLSGGGIPVVEGLLLAINGATTEAVRSRLDKAYQLVIRGGSLAEGFDDDFFPPVVSRAISHGEVTGKFDVQFSGVAEFLRERAERKIEVASTLIEPALILVGGGIVLFIAMAIFAPIYGSLQNMGR